MGSVQQRGSGMTEAADVTHAGPVSAIGDRAVVAAWLRAEREKRGWSRPEMARRLRYAAHANDDHSVPGLDSMQHNIYRWERGADGISERYRLLYKSVLGIAPPTAESAGNHAASCSAITLTITIELPPFAQAALSASSGQQPPPGHIPAANIAANGHGPDPGKED